MNDERRTVDHPTAVDPMIAVDLARIERDLAGVEAALERLDDGTYWTDEITGATIPDDLLAADPVTRRAERRQGEDGASMS